MTGYVNDSNVESAVDEILKCFHTFLWYCVFIRLYKVVLTFESVHESSLIL